MLQLASAGAAHALISRKSNAPKASIRRRIACAVRSVTAMPLSQWLRTTASHTSSVYVHSNDGKVDSHEELGRGVLTYSQMNEVAAAIGPDANLILKMNDKERLERSLKWLESCFTQGGHTR